MPIEYEVEPGDCLSSVAFEHGFFPDAIWNHGSNTDLKESRKDPSVLMPGDKVIIPDKELSEVSRPTEQKHKFRKKSARVKLRIRVLKKGKPRKNEVYRLDIDGDIREGSTNDDGFITERLPANAEFGKLTVGEGAGRQVFALNFGYVDPLDTDDGVAGRLHNLGYSAARDLPGAIKKFQSDQGLQPTGAVDDTTRSKLKEAFGQ